ncbi:regulator of g protein signaling domain containing protein [Sporothrix brasiliensis 5110]|uniref:Regulator of g protein signaling domain containing protein n=1 Tax=Sporothrix brasiliensis 5110 TaxID=1398154 RepID=A0A0C2JDH5_9PEZI|nr:regulator of g protein signaling domain containing protein [Sporothrix brasiliensis 5110]KIH95002.1 regulator of g protein signaling domain containing protein [Sporothrix brasiliensis 5110]
MASSRPTSVAFLAATNRPTLKDILANSAPPPWTLGAFMAYLSQNHCLETLEFTMEAERYQTTFAQVQLDEGQDDAAQWSQDARDYTCAIWRRLLGTYITPLGPREVNLPGPVRDRLLALDKSRSPPHPRELNEAVTIVYDLMNDSVLLSFVDSVNTTAHEQDQPMTNDADDHQQHDARQGRTRMRMPKDSSRPRGDDSSRSPKPSFLPQLNLTRRSEGRGRSPSASSADASSVERVGLIDDNGSSTPPAGEPLTPPTTPPTSDWNFSTSPNGLQRAISVHNAGWKRMSAKLGLGSLNRMTRSSRRPNNTSNGSNHSTVACEGSSSASADGDASSGMAVDQQQSGQNL